MTHMSIFLTVAAAIVGVLGTARLTRLISQDSFPPSAWFRAKWQKVTRHGEWSVLVTCPYCVSVYLAFGNLAWFLIGYNWSEPLLIAWWIVNGALATAYLAAMVVQYDGE